MSIMKQGYTRAVAGLIIACTSWGESLSTNRFLQGEGARIAPLPCTVATLEQGAAIFTDRTFLFHAPPDGLKGLPFFKASIHGNLNVSVIQAGLLTIITPDPDVARTSCSHAAELERAGFIWIQAPAGFQCFGSNTIDRCRIYQKRVTPGEHFQLSKWAIYAGFDPQGQSFYRPSERVRRVIESLKSDTQRLDAAADAQDIQVNRPDYVVYVPHQPREKTKRDPSRPGDTYNDHFQVLEHNGNLFAFWTQASREADIDQHIAFSKSLDKGETWSAPMILAGSPNKKTPGLLASWQQPMFSKSGRLYLLWNQQTTSRGPHCGQMFGFYSDDEGASWSAPKMVPMHRMSRDPEDPLIPPSWCNWQCPLRLGKDGRYFVGVSRHGKRPGETKNSCTIEFLQFDNIDANPAIENIQLSWFSTNDQVLKVEHEKFGSACEEAAVVKLPDGRLFSLMRTCAGHPFWSQSRDQGQTWTQPKPLLDRDGGTPYLHPRSPCPLYDWKGAEAASGFYFALVHNTFDFAGDSEYQKRGPLYLIAGRFNPKAEQPIEFLPPKLFAPRENGNSFYTSYTVVDGKGILWFPDTKFYLLGREIDETWFQPSARPNARGERLYNGIVLPPMWPPRTINPRDTRPMAVPYLEHPPAVIPIDVGRQLFVDDFLIATSTLTRVFHLPKKYDGNPILKPETPLEIQAGKNSAAVPKSGGVWWDPVEKIFKMWYEAGWIHTICYATSRDGLHWERPALDVNPGTNQILPLDLTPDSWTVVPDWNAPDPLQRYKMFMRPPGGQMPGISMTSPDGIHWTNRVVTGETGDRSTLFYNPFRKKWIYSLRSSFRGRSRHYWECDDFLKGAVWSKTDPVVWAAADQDDPKDADTKRTPQLYNLDAVAYESLMLGFFEIHHGPENDVCEKQGLPKITELNFAYSRDGFHWSRPDRRIAIRAERRDVWDRGYVQSLGNLCCIRGDTLWFYYSGFQGDATKTNRFWLKNGMYDRGATGLAFLRRDGFAAMTADEQGSLTTRPVIFTGSRLFVNAACAKGTLRVEILDQAGNPIEPYTLEACQPLSADSTLMPITWKTTADLTALRGQPVRLRFVLTQGALYSFWVSRDATGRSDGYVAGGGPGFTGMTDTIGRATLEAESQINPSGIGSFFNH